MTFTLGPENFGRSASTGLFTDRADDGVGSLRVMTSVGDDHTTTLPRKRMASGALFTDRAGRVLLVEPTYKDYWEVPGGGVEADESPYDAAVREVREELGLQVTPGRLLAVDWVPPRSGRTEGIMFIYAGEVLDAERERGIVLPAEELRSWAWCTESEADERLSPLLARRVRAAVEALRQNTTCYLEDGTPVA
jgi:ADP-ribose pyrophosphatase YjhB (NUDIX family)